MCLKLFLNVAASLKANSKSSTQMLLNVAMNNV